MNRVQPHALWIGHAGDARDVRQLMDADVKAVVQVAAEEPPLALPRELIYCRFPLIDGQGNRPELLYLAVSVVASLIKLRVPTLVCCGMGESRSPAVAAAALAMVHQEPCEDWLPRVVEHHASDVSPGLWGEVVGLLPSVR
jgi:protein-tyrosine phosphatase